MTCPATEQAAHEPDADPAGEPPTGSGASTGECKVPGAKGGDSPLRFMENLIRQQGDVVRFDGAFGPVVLFNHPDQVQAVMHGANFVRTPLLSMVLGQGLLASEGDYWRGQRRLMQPSFHECCLPGLVRQITDTTQAMLRRWDEASRDGIPLDMAEEMRRLSFEVMARALFGASLEDDAAEWITAVSALLDDLEILVRSQFNLGGSFVPGRNATFRRALDTIDGKVRNMIAGRRAAKDPPRDLLSALVFGKEEKSGRPLSERQIRDEIVTMLIASYETTAVALGWVLHVLGTRPEVQEEIGRESDEVLQERAPVAADLAGLDRTRRVVEEAMRLYPPVWAVVRQTATDDELGGCRIPAKTMVLTSAYTTHRHPGFWEEPERFLPDRFDPERSRGRHRYAYFPFAGGRHVCIGQSFAMTETVLVMAMMLRRFKLLPVPGREVEVQYTVTLRQRHGPWMTVASRGQVREC